MRRLLSISIVILLVTAEITAAQRPPQQTAAQTIISTTRQSQFFIPIGIDPSLEAEIREVELVYSVDQGKNWYTYQKITPDKKQFQFNAKRDNEYWFIFRSINQKGEAKLAQPSIPTIRVLVDTTPPKLQFAAKCEKTGEVTIDWSAEDVAFATDTPEIYLSYDMNVTWRPLAIDFSKIIKNGMMRSGRTVFHPPAGTKKVDIRCEVSDSAGNREIRAVKLDLTEPSAVSVANTVGTIQESPGETVSVMPVLPPRPTLKKSTADSLTKADVSADPTGSAAAPSAVKAESLESVHSNLRFDSGDTMLPQNAESLPRYAEEAKPEHWEFPPLAENPGESQNSIITVHPELKPFDLPLSGPGIESSVIKENDAEDIFPDKTAPTEKPETVEPEPVFPGKITLISLKESTAPQLAVRWFKGNDAVQTAKVDIYRSRTRQGPWLPIVFDLENTGEYLWNISAGEFSPFYLRIDLRSVEGLYTDFTSREINLMAIVKPK
ncbi:MAG: hypothetical protein LBQ54_11625 [Planctomycetaceae bacterium]|nr:hypothetical protein [Planctomycetaceae bacterium]